VVRTKRGRIRVPRTETITISDPVEGETYASIMKRVIAAVDLKDVGVDLVGKTRRTRTATVLIEVKGCEVADKLAFLLRGVVGDTARVNRPSRKTKILLTNVPEWVEVDEVAEYIATSDFELTGVLVVMNQRLEEAG